MGLLQKLRMIDIYIYIIGSLKKKTRYIYIFNIYIYLIYIYIMYIILAIPIPRHSNVDQSLVENLILIGISVQQVLETFPISNRFQELDVVFHYVFK